MLVRPLWDAVTCCGSREHSQPNEGQDVKGITELGAGGHFFAEGDNTVERNRRVAELGRLLQAELQDLELPPAERKCGDVFEGPDEDVCHQLLADAFRANYSIDQVDFCYNSSGGSVGGSCSSSPRNFGGSVEGGSESATAAFASRLADAVRRSLGANGEDGKRRTGLMRIVSMLLSQAGLALVGSACRGPHLALSGGDRICRYELDCDLLRGGWVLRMTFLAEGFTEYIDACALDEDPQPCLPTSMQRRGCVVHLSLHDGLPSGVQAVVDEVVDTLRLLDSEGRPVELQQPPKDAAAHSLQQQKMTQSSSWWPDFNFLAPASPTSTPGSPAASLTAGAVEAVARVTSTIGGIVVLGENGAARAHKADADAEEEHLRKQVVPVSPVGFTFSANIEQSEEEEGEGEEEQGGVDDTKGVPSPSPSKIKERRAWEWEGMRFAPVPDEDEVLSAWFGHPINEQRRTDVTDEVRRLVAAAHTAGNSPPKELVLPTHVARWGDPAYFVQKQLCVMLRDEDSPRGVEKGRPG